ncbi:hypothetical protein AGR13a_Lc110055 [Agrobacterium genomosp. 13 str. CFBP 6927]|uniref:Uncharacterized protein n=1 Tax=Agrobacterium genomosp. 13 str. CFBP 6927 TaxID=1183428 RepID=A0ABM9VJB1_9HYPH|nr:hypothetical protein AGR13a_Lc110055 [Agrobacterium genomosp. 13 str. CFBP 6927]
MTKPLDNQGFDLLVGFGDQVKVSLLLDRQGGQFFEVV